MLGAIVTLLCIGIIVLYIHVMFFGGGVDGGDSGVE